jgi:hypothetical protein
MKTKSVQLMACIAWAALAVSSASPASANAETFQTGSYALCSMRYTTANRVNCNGTFNYNMEIKLVNESCNKGSCTPVDNTVYTEFRYKSGRNITTLLSSCTTWNLYGFGSCGC